MSERGRLLCAGTAHTQREQLQLWLENTNICNLFFLLAPPQDAALLQEPSIGRPVYIKVVRMIIETEEVSESAIFISMIKELRDPANVKFTD